MQEDGTWRPASGSFTGWPAEAKALTVLDPCCGSGHFLTEALSALAALRRAEERLSPSEAVTAVLRDNLAGLEIDGRCVQIAAFNLALTGWRIGGPGAALPTPNVAWVGAPPPLPKAEFAALANGDDDLRRGFEALHDLFLQAPLLGSLIEPVGGDLADPRRVARLEDSIAALVERMRGAEPERAEGVVAARGMADAAAILGQRWALQVTNVPFLTEIKFQEDLDRFIGQAFPISRQNMATVFIDRMLRLCGRKGVVAFVAPQSWLYLKRYGEIRKHVFSKYAPAKFIRLGQSAFEHPDSNGEAISLNVILGEQNYNPKNHSYLDVSKIKDIDDRQLALKQDKILIREKDSSNPSNNFTISGPGEASGKQLRDFASALLGISTSDSPRFIGRYWEVPTLRDVWEFLHTTSAETRHYSGMTDIVKWEKEAGELAELAYSLRHVNHNVQNWRRGKPNWGKVGVCVSQMAPFPATLYEGNIYDSNCCAIVPKNQDDLPRLWAFVSSKEFCELVQNSNGNRKVEVGTFLSLDVDLDQWMDASEGDFEALLPDPYSDDPTQWIFHGDPRYATSGTELHVALARLAGYRWPAEIDTTMQLSAESRARIADIAALPAADADGLLPLPPLLGERGLADRLRAWCAAAWGKAWTADTEAALITAACERANDRLPRSLTLDAWLRTHAARQHAKLFHDRPFLWWITDGRADGFMAVVHYHRLTRDALSRLAFHVLGDHLARLGEDPRAEAARILQKKLEQIIEGEAPLDIFVRWKPAHEQPLGWDPDLNDGVRLNIRPFIEADVLAHVPNGVHYRTDRGKDVPSAPWYGVFKGERRNDHHTTLAEKRAARAAVGGHSGRAAE